MEQLSGAPKSAGAGLPKVSVTKSPMGQIELESNKLHDKIVVLMKAIDVLGERLHNVLVPPLTPTANEAVNADLVPLASSLEEASNKLAVLVARIEDLTSRIEL